jgi:hypothetical protein
LIDETITYIPETWTVTKDVIYASIVSIKNGLEYARECLSQHESALGRTTYKNRTWAETIEKDILQMEKTLEDLKSL